MARTESTILAIIKDVIIPNQVPAWAEAARKGKIETKSKIAFKNLIKNRCIQCTRIGPFQKFSVVSSIETGIKSARKWPMAAFSRESSLGSALRWLDYIFRSRGIILSQFSEYRNATIGCVHEDAICAIAIILSMFYI